MYGRQYAWAIGGLLFLLLSFVLGGWAWERWQFAQQTHGPSGNHVIKHTSVMQSDANKIMNMSGASLIIPSIKVNAPIEPVGVSSDGAMAVPTLHQWTDVGWYKNGPLPGDRGSAVIDGHLDRPGGSAAVFWNLRYMHIGDLVVIADAKGHMQRFQVTKMATYPPGNAPTQEIFADTSGTYLNLITCAGTWIPAQHQTTLRLVVYAKSIS